MFEYVYGLHFIVAFNLKAMLLMDLGSLHRLIEFITYFLVERKIYTGLDRIGQNSRSSLNFDEFC